MRREFVLATFSEEEKLVEAVRQVRQSGCKVYDVFTPYPVHGLSEAMGLRQTRLAYVTLVFGLLGLALAMGFQFYAAVFDWPVDVGGKPANSTLAFVPITFEITILLGGLSTAGAFLLRTRLFPGLRPRLHEEGVTEDTFVVALLRQEGSNETDQARQILQDSGARQIRERTVQ